MSEIKTIEQALRKVQIELKAPKGQYNSFGKYAYRNAEDILEAVKPLLDKYELTLKTSDSIQMLGDRFYVRSTARLIGYGSSVDANGWAREEETKKGMDGAQITGAASSYARKYAYNGLFSIDDTKDADSNEHREQVNNTKSAPKTQPVAPAKPTEAQLAKITELAKELGIKEADIPAKVAKVTTKALAEATIKKMESDVHQIKVNGGND